MISPSEPTKEVPLQAAQPPPVIGNSTDTVVITKVPPLMPLDDVLPNTEDRDDTRQDPSTRTKDTTASISGVIDQGKQRPLDDHQRKVSGEDGAAMANECSIPTLIETSTITQSVSMSVSVSTSLSVATPSTSSPKRDGVDVAKKIFEERDDKEEENEGNTDGSHPTKGEVVVYNGAVSKTTRTELKTPKASVSGKPTGIDTATNTEEVEHDEVKNGDDKGNKGNKDDPNPNNGEEVVSNGAVLSETSQIELATRNGEITPLEVKRARTSTRKRSISVKMAESNLNVLRESQLKVTDIALDTMMASTVNNAITQPRIRPANSNSNTHDSSSTAEDAKKITELLKRRKSKRKHIRAPETASEATDPQSNPREDSLAKGIYMAMIRSESETTTTTPSPKQTPPTTQAAKRRRVQSPTNTQDTEMLHEEEEYHGNEERNEEVVEDVAVGTDLQKTKSTFALTTPMQATSNGVVTTTNGVTTECLSLTTPPFDAVNTDVAKTVAARTDAAITDAAKTDAVVTNGSHRSMVTVASNTERAGGKRHRSHRPSSSSSDVDHDILNMHKTNVSDNADFGVGVSKTTQNRALTQATKRAEVAEAKLKLAEQRAELLESKLTTVVDLVRLLSQAAKNEDV